MVKHAMDKGMWEGRSKQVRYTQGDLERLCKKKKCSKRDL